MAGQSGRYRSVRLHRPWKTLVPFSPSMPSHHMPTARKRVLSDSGSWRDNSRLAAVCFHLESLLQKKFLPKKTSTEPEGVFNLKAKTGTLPWQRPRLGVCSRTVQGCSYIVRRVRVSAWHRPGKAAGPPRFTCAEPGFLAAIPPGCAGQSPADRKNPARGGFFPKLEGCFEEGRTYSVWMKHQRCGSVCFLSTCSL